MTRKCKHPKWNPPAIKYTQATRVPTRVNGITHDDTLLSMSFGLSTITQTCEECGFARSYTVAGDAR